MPTQTLTSGSLSSPWDKRMHSTSFERSTNFLQHKILTEWIEALLKWFMLCQSSLILLHKMAFQRFWLPITVFLVFQFLFWYGQTFARNRGQRALRTQKFNIAYNDEIYQLFIKFENFILQHFEFLKFSNFKILKIYLVLKILFGTELCMSVAISVSWRH